MSATVLGQGPMTRVADRILHRSGSFLIGSALLAGAALISPNWISSLILAALVGVLLSCLAISALLCRIKRSLQTQALDLLSQMLPTEGAMVMLSDGMAQMLSPAPMETAVSNRQSGQETTAVSLTSYGFDLVAIRHLANRAIALGRIRDDNHLGQVDVIRIAPDLLIWFFSGGANPAAATAARAPEGSLRLPMLRVGKTGTILFLNAAARGLLGGRAKSLEQVFLNAPPRGGEIAEVAIKGGSRSCLIAESAGAAGCREIYLLPPPVPGVDGANSVSFDSLPVPLLKVAPDGKILQANGMARQLICQAITRHTVMSDLMEGLGRSIADWLCEAAAGRGLHHSEFLRLKRTDSETFVQVTITRLQENGKVSLIAVLNDATELKTLEAQFVQSQKMQAIGQLAGGVAHDFNNLLTAISGHCDLLLLRHDQGDPDYGDLVQINQNSNRAAALVGQLLAFSRKQTLRPEVVDLRDTLSELTHLLNRLVGEKVSLSLSHDPTLATIRADKRQLEQVLMNLVVNARDAMVDGGDITIQTAGVRLEIPLTRDRAVVPPGDYVSVKVSDNGCGIAPDNLAKVFEPFFTTKRTGDGTGLGLSTAYGIVKQSGGYIFIDSVVGAGTSFTLFFPVYDQLGSRRKQTIAPAIDNVQPNAGGVVLLVEDEAPVRAFASRALRLRGFTVLEADSGEAALKTLEDASLNIDLFVTDVVMPGLDGPGWVRQARRQRPDVKVVFVSGYAEDSFADQQAQISGSVFLPKPFSLAELTTLVQNQII